MNKPAGLQPDRSTAAYNHKLYKPRRVSLNSDIMTIHIHYRPMKEVRELPPRIRIIEPELRNEHPVDRYLTAVDQEIQAAHAPSAYAGLGDIAATVFANQHAQHETKTRHLAKLVYERVALGNRQVQEVDEGIDKLRARIPLQPRGPGNYVDGTLNEAERRILDLEKQKRALQLTLWRDTVDLRTNLLTERVEQQAMDRRLSLLSGGAYGDR